MRARAESIPLLKAAWERLESIKTKKFADPFSSFFTERFPAADQREIEIYHKCPKQLKYYLEEIQPG